MASKTPRSSRAAGSRADAVAAGLDHFVTEQLAEVLPRQRWFGSKARRITSVSVLDAAALGGRAPGAWFVLLDVGFAEGPRERYSVPLLVSRARPEACDVLGRMEAAGVQAVVVDALDAPGFCRSLLEAFDEGLTLRARRGTIRFVRSAGVARLAAGLGLASRRLRGEQSNTSVVYGDRLILKAFRKLEFGINPEHEITDFLTARARFAHVPQLAGAVEYAPDVGEGVTLAVLHRFMPNQGNGWSWVLEHLEWLRDFIATRVA